MRPYSPAAARARVSTVCTQHHGWPGGASCPRAPARAAALARADAPRRELPVLVRNGEIDAAAPAPKREAAGHAGRRLAEPPPSQIAVASLLCERGCRCGCAKKYFAGPENLTDATHTRALLRGYDQQPTRHLGTCKATSAERRAGREVHFCWTTRASRVACRSPRGPVEKDQIYKLQAELKAGIVADAVAGGTVAAAVTATTSTAGATVKRVLQEARAGGRAKLTRNSSLMILVIVNPEFRTLEPQPARRRRRSLEDTYANSNRFYLKMWWKSVDGKDLSGPAARRTSRSAWRVICELRSAYRATMRVERCFTGTLGIWLLWSPGAYYSRRRDADTCQFRLAGTDAGATAADEARGRPGLRPLPDAFWSSHVKADANLHLTTLDGGSSTRPPHAAAASRRLAHSG